MPDIVIHRNYLTGRANVKDQTRAGLAFLAAHIDADLAASGLVTCPNDLVEEFRNDLKKLDNNIDIEVV